ncbi:MAG: hypothetical protein CL833_12080 [Crocinitomicaceae bacterium]|nr:hypothetical protein [Crocinitomicaceae bacterium]
MSEELQENTEAQTEEVLTGESEQPQETQTERPDWLPEKFDRPEELANSYQELERAFYTRKEELRNQIVGELNEEATSSAPISPGDYELNFNAPEGIEYSVADDDPMVEWFRSTAHGYGLSQDEFDGLMNEYIQIDAMRGPDWNVESESLGEYADKRLERVDGWATTHLSEKAYDVFANIPASAGMVELFEELMEVAGQPQFNMTSDSEFQEVLSLDDLRSMQNDPKYWKEKDPAFIAKVRQGFNQYSRRNG